MAGNKTQKVICNCMVNCKLLLKLISSDKQLVCVSVLSCKSSFKLISIFIIMQERNKSCVNLLLFSASLLNSLS